MNLTLERLQLDDQVTIGRMSVDGSDWTCWTCEDTVRDPGVKIHGATAIPAGTYQVQITHSPRFNRLLPLLLDVPGFSGVRIHPGNTADDTEGCILVGHVRMSEGVGKSRMAFDELLPMMQSVQDDGEPITLTIVNSPE